MWWVAAGRTVVADVHVQGLGLTKGKRFGDGVVVGQFAGRKTTELETGK